jgi:hypothetical protein
MPVEYPYVVIGQIASIFFVESHPKIDKAAREHLEENWTYTFGIHEYLLARLDIIEGLQGDSLSQALAEIQQARVRPLLGRGSISAETYQIYLPADTRAKVSATTSRKPRRANNRGPEKSKKPKSKNSNNKSPAPVGSNGLRLIRARRLPRR